MPPKRGEKRKEPSPTPSQSSQSSEGSEAELARLLVAAHKARRQSKGKKTRRSRSEIRYSSASPYADREPSPPAARRGAPMTWGQPAPTGRQPSASALAAPIAPANKKAASAFGAPFAAPLQAPLHSLMEEGEESHDATPLIAFAPPPPNRGLSRKAPSKRRAAPQKAKTAVPTANAVSRYQPERGVSPSVGLSRGWIPVDRFEFEGTRTELVEIPAAAAGGGRRSLAAIVQVSPAAEKRVESATTTDPDAARKKIKRLRAKLAQTMMKFPTKKAAEEERNTVFQSLEKMYIAKSAVNYRGRPVMHGGVHVTHPRLAGTVLVPLFYSKSMVAKICLIAINRRKRENTSVAASTYPTGEKLDEWLHHHLDTIWGNPDFCSEIPNFHTDVIGQNLALRDETTMQVIRHSADFEALSDLANSELDSYLKDLRERLNLINKTIAAIPSAGVRDNMGEDTVLGQILPKETKADLEKKLAGMDRSINELLRQFRLDHPSGEISEALFNSLSAIVSYGTITVITGGVAAGGAAAISSYARQALISAITSRTFAQTVGTAVALACPDMISGFIGGLLDIVCARYAELCEHFGIVKRNVGEVRQQIYEAISGVFYVAGGEEPPGAGGGAATLEKAVEKMGERVIDVCWVYEPQHLEFATHDEAAIAWGETLDKSLRRLDKEQAAQEMRLALAFRHGDSPLSQASLDTYHGSDEEQTGYSGDESEKESGGGIRKTRKLLRRPNKRRSRRT